MRLRKIVGVCVGAGIGAVGLLGLCGNSAGEILAENAALTRAVAAAQVTIPRVVERISCSPYSQPNQHYGYTCSTKLFGRDTPAQWGVSYVDPVADYPVAEGAIANLAFALSRTQNGSLQVVSHADSTVISAPNAAAAIQAIAGRLPSAPFVVNASASPDVREAISNADWEKTQKQNADSWKN
jgi:hypothetical protein